MVINKHVQGCSPHRLSKGVLIPINRNTGIKNTPFLTVKRRAAEVNSLAEISAETIDNQEAHFSSVRKSSTSASGGLDFDATLLRPAARAAPSTSN